MKTFDGVPILKEEGYCPLCGVWYELRRHGLPDHVCTSTEKRCKFSACSPSHVRYAITTDEEMHAVARYLLSHEESDPCLINTHTQRHTVVCQGGDVCRKIMMRLRNAYVGYAESRMKTV